MSPWIFPDGGLCDIISMMNCVLILHCSDVRGSMSLKYVSKGPSMNNLGHQANLSTLMQGRDKGLLRKSRTHKYADNPDDPMVR
jgi:hypothetical protein